MSKKLGKNIISLICGGNIDSKIFNKIISWPWYLIQMKSKIV
jgi:hypothetical protein